MNLVGRQVGRVKSEVDKVGWVKVVGVKMIVLYILSKGDLYYCCWKQN